MIPEYSRDLAAIPPYPFVQLERVARERRRQGLKVLSFSIGDPDLPTPSYIMDALNQAAHDSSFSGYSSVDGEPWFREAVAAWYKKRFGVELDPESEVCALIGSKEGLANISRAFVNKGDVVVYPDPGYPVYANGGAVLLGATPRAYRLRDEQGFEPLLDSDTLRGAKIVYANYPNNPTGGIISEGHLRALAEMTSSAGALLCYDNAYSEMTYGNYTAPSVLQTRSDHEGVVEFHSCSKTFSMTGYRIGFAVGDRKGISGLVKVKSQIDSGPPKFVQHAAKVALDSYQGPERPVDVQSAVDVYRDRLEKLVGGLSRMGYKVNVPPATFYLWQKVDTDSTSFAERLANLGVLVTPGTAFGRWGDGYVRWSVTQPTERIAEALELISSS